MFFLDVDLAMKGHQILPIQFWLQTLHRNHQKRLRFPTFFLKKGKNSMFTYFLEIYETKTPTTWVAASLSINFAFNCSM
ncbi:hypothetical protein DERF_003563, partial [Dermatophagoides farinae]